MADSKVVHINVPIELWEAFDEARKGEHTTRTDAILYLMREYVRKRKEALTVE